MNNAANVTQMRDKFPYKNTAVQLAFEAEIKRIAIERAEPMADVIAKLAKLSNVDSRQIYNYRSGKSAITPEQIKIFCEQFDSIALGMAWLSSFEISRDEFELYDLSRVASNSVRNVLKCGDKFLSAFEDGKIDGFEMNDLELAGAEIQRDTVQMVEIARHAFNRRHVS